MEGDLEYPRILLSGPVRNPHGFPKEDRAPGDGAVSYQEFLSRKTRMGHDAGITVDPAAFHPSLREDQKHVTTWALRKGRAALFLDTGLGKTRDQLEWARLTGERTLLLAPLSVARQTVREAAKIDMEVRYLREDDHGPGPIITNYEMAERFNPLDFGAVVLDESSILKNVAGKTREKLTATFAHTPMRLACTATPAPNDVAELCNHAEFLGVMSRAEMLASFFIHDDVGWRLKGHAAEPMYRWMTTWSIAMRQPSDLGFSNEGFNLPPLRIYPEIVEVHLEPEGQLFATELGGVSGRAQVRRTTLLKRVERAAKLAIGFDQWIVWCGLNDEARLATEAISGAVNVEGSWTPEAKAEALEAFQDGDIRVLVTKPSIAGFGMNFQNCHNMAFLGLSDSYEAYYQAIRRCYRYGQAHEVNAHIIVSELEQQIVENVRAKEVEASHTIDALIRHMGEAA